jgi:TonB family protein
VLLILGDEPLTTWGTYAATSKGADEQSSRRAPGSLVDPGVCVWGRDSYNRAMPDVSHKPKFHPRSPVQPGRSVAPYFILALLAAILMWAAQQYWLASPREDSTFSAIHRAAAPIQTRKPSKGDVRTLFSGDDYPASALRNGEEGTVQARLTVGANGRVTRCDVIRSSGSDTLDTTTCSILQRRARFVPARDSVGKAAASTYVTPPIKWQLEG